MNHAATLVPLVLTPKAHFVADSKRFDAWSEVDVVTHQERRPRCETQNEPLVPRTIEIVGQQFFYAADSLDENPGLLLAKQSRDVRVLLCGAR